WVLTFYFVESFSCRGIALFDHLVHSFIVEIIDGLFDIDVLFRATACGESGHQNSCAEPAKNGQSPHSPPRSGSRISFISQIACRIGRRCLALRLGEMHRIPALDRRETCRPSQGRMTPCLGIGKQRRQQLSGMAMARAHPAKLTDDWAACEIKIAKSVEQLMA